MSLIQDSPVDCSQVFTLDFIVPATDIDELGHVNNAVYLRYVETVARAHSDSLGFTVVRFLETGAVPVVRMHRVTYHRPGKVGDLLTAHTRIATMAGVRAMRATRIMRGDELLVEAETDWVWVDPSTMRPMKIPAEVKAAFGGAS